MNAMAELNGGEAFDAQGASSPPGFFRSLLLGLVDSTQNMKSCLVGDLSMRIPAGLCGGAAGVDGARMGFARRRRRLCCFCLGGIWAFAILSGLEATRASS